MTVKERARELWEALAWLTDDERLDHSERGKGIASIEQSLTAAVEEKKTLFTAGIETALANIKEVLAATQFGQRVSCERGMEALTLFNWLFGEWPYEGQGVLIKAQQDKIRSAVEEMREACSEIARLRAELKHKVADMCEPESELQMSVLLEAREAELIEQRIRNLPIT